MIQVGARRYNLNDLTDRDLGEIVRAVTIPPYKDQVRARQIVNRLRCTLVEAEALRTRFQALPRSPASSLR